MNVIEALNIEYVKVFADVLEAKMKLGDFHRQTLGFLHGGVTLAFAETVAGMASNEILDENIMAVGQSVTASHVKAKVCEGYVVAKGCIIHKGKKSHVWVLDIVDEQEAIISHITVTNAVVARHSPAGK